MSDEKVYTPETISENPLPNQEGLVSYGETSKGSENSGYGQATISQQVVPTKRIATELISEKINTKTRKILAEFTFTPSGAIQIGDYKSGETGEIKISPDGIIAVNKYGDTTFLLDGESGDAIFTGTIQTGTLISGLVQVGGNNIVIDGESRTIIINDGTNDRILIGYQKNGF